MSVLATRLSALRQWMKDQGLDGFVIWRGDMFSGEEVRACDERLAFISGFTGSAGYALVLMDEAFMLSDGRYHLQMQNQLDKSLWQWRDASQGALCDLLSQRQKRTLQTTMTLGFDGYTTTIAQYEKLPETAGEAVIKWQSYDSHPLDNIWHDRPAFNRHPAYLLGDEIAGQSVSDKIKKAQTKLREAGHDGLFISAPDCVNWLLNIRGSDLANTPFHLAFAYLPAEGAPMLCGAMLEGALGQSYQVLSFDALANWWPTLTGKVISIDPASLPYALQSQMQKADITLIKEACSLMLPKAKKNKIELAGFDAAHLSDALAFCQFWYELETKLSPLNRHETDLVSILQSHRQKQDGYICDSFDTIMGSGANGAIIHYRAIEGQDSLIQNNTLLLIDSGAHYQTGTTDITRTLLMGHADEEMIACYSAVLCAHAALAMTRFPEHTTGQAIDAICRAPLWAQGLDFAHGTGHGVGHILSVHEGPASISKRGAVPLEAGMVLSNEPGYYREGAWGIRLENLVSIYEETDGFFRFKDITLVPFERALIDIKALDEKTLTWLNSYHERVADMLIPHLDEGVREWLLGKTAPLGK